MSTTKKQAIFPGGNDTSQGVYSPGIVTGNLVFVSGQGPLDPQTGQIVEGTVAEQTQLTLQNVERILKEAGCTLNDCVKTTVHLSDIADFGEFNKAYGQCFAKPYPTRTTVQSGLNGIKVEIDVIAVKN